MDFSMKVYNRLSSRQYFSHKSFRDTIKILQHSAQKTWKYLDNLFICAVLPIKSFFSSESENFLKWFRDWEKKAQTLHKKVRKNFLSFNFFDIIERYEGKGKNAERDRLAKGNRFRGTFLYSMYQLPEEEKRRKLFQYFLPF